MSRESLWESMGSDSIDFHEAPSRLFDWRARVGRVALSLFASGVALCGVTRAVQSQNASAPASYRLLVGAESDDEVALVEFTPCAGGRAPRAESATCGARVVRTYAVGVWSVETEGPHGVVASRDGKAFYVSIAHGRPNGYLQKFDLETGERVGEVELGMFPATVDISAAADLVYVINFNFEDPAMGPSSLSVVDGASMLEIARTTTCRMPHGSRLDPLGRRHYSACMMDDQLVEIDALTFAVTRRFGLAPGKEGPVVASGGGHEGHDMESPVSNACSPTWAQPSADGRRVFVACNRSNEIVEVDVAGWSVTRRWKTPAAPYNLAVTADGKYIVCTQKGPGTATIWRLSDAALAAELKGTRGVASGVVVSGDSRYAFVTLEGVGGEPGTVDVIDLATLRKAGSVDVGKQAGGIAVVP